MRLADLDSGARPRLTTEERQRLQTLECENRRLRHANEILKAAALPSGLPRARTCHAAAPLYGMTVTVGHAMQPARQLEEQAMTVGSWQHIQRSTPLALVSCAVVLLLVGCRSQAALSPVKGGGNAGSEAALVRVLTGGPHTVHHSDLPLPMASTPRDDGKPTLVWFSATWCTTCASMEAWATETGKDFAGRVAFVEKSVDHDRDAASRYAVRGTPTFVMIDASGKEFARFFVQPSAAAFRGAIEDGLRKGGA